MEQIEIRHFGPIKNVKMNINKVNVLIGKTSSGKSTVAKLICIFNSNQFIGSGELDTFKSLLKDYNIDFEITEKTFFNYKKDNYNWTLKNKEFTNNYPFKGLTSMLRPLFEQVLSKEKRSDGYKLNKAMLSLLLLNTIDFESLEIENNATINNTRALEISNQIESIKNYRNQILHGDSLRIDEIVEKLGEFYMSIRDEIEIYNPLYIPAERIILSMVAESVFGLLKNDISLANCIKDFGSRFESARKEMKEIDIKLLNAKYSYTDKTNYITLSDGASIKLEQASSGFQSLTPLYVVVENFIDKKNIIKQFVTVEEPELNLYPTVQLDLVEYLVEKINSTKDKIIFTTHSPYVLTSIDNLIQAHNVFKEKPELKEKINEIKSSTKWLDFDNVTCHYFENGKSKSTLDKENRNIGSSNIDDVSIEIGDTFERLIELKYS